MGPSQISGPELEDGITCPGDLFLTLPPPLVLGRVPLSVWHCHGSSLPTCLTPTRHTQPRSLSGTHLQPWQALTNHCTTTQDAALSQTHNTLHATVQRRGFCWHPHPAPPAHFRAASAQALSPEPRRPLPHPPAPRPAWGPYPLSSSSSSRDWVRSELQCRHHMAAAAGVDGAERPGLRPRRALPTPAGVADPGPTPDHRET